MGREVALLCAAFPSKLFTDCMSEFMESARSSKIRLCRVFMIVAEQLEGTIDALQWMPAHTSHLKRPLVARSAAMGVSSLIHCGFPTSLRI